VCVCVCVESSYSNLMYVCTCIPYPHTHVPPRTLYLRTRLAVIKKYSKPSNATLAQFCTYFWGVVEEMLECAAQFGAVEKISEVGAVCVSVFIHMCIHVYMCTCVHVCVCVSVCLRKVASHTHTMHVCPTHAATDRGRSGRAVV
jgi:hypothetical protein